MTYEDGTIFVQKDGGAVDVDFIEQPTESAWIGIHGVDVCIRRVPGVDGGADTLVVSVWEKGSISSPLAELETELRRAE